MFAATYLMLKTGPELKKLRAAITTLTVVAAKSNGMSAVEVKAILAAVRDSSNRGRSRAEDQIDDGFGSNNE